MDLKRLLTVFARRLREKLLFRCVQVCWNVGNVVNSLVFLVNMFKQYCGSESITLVTQLCGAADGQDFIAWESFFLHKQAKKPKSLNLNLSVGGLLLASRTCINVQVFSQHMEDEI